MRTLEGAAIPRVDPDKPRPAACAVSEVDFDTLLSAEGGVDTHAATDLFCTAEWFANLARNGIDPGAQPLLLMVRPAGGNGICLPLLNGPGSRAALYGRALSGLSNYYSSLFGPIGDPAACNADACAALARALGRRGAVLDLQPLDKNGPLLENLRQALRREGWWVDEYFCFGNWHLDVAGRSFAQYEPTLPSRLRNTIRRGRKKLEASGPWSLDVVHAPGADLERAIDDWQAIYAKSWKVPEPHPAFVPELCRMAARMGWLRLGVVRVGPTPVAAQIWLQREGRAQIFKLAYDEEYKRFSAGSVLSAEMMRRAIDVDGCVDVDYLTGDDGYKADWMSHRRERVGLLAFRPGSAQGLISAARHYGGRLLKRLRHRDGARPTVADRADSPTAGSDED